MKKKIKISAILYCIIIVLIIILGFCIFNIYKGLKSSSAKEVEILSTIDEYGYSLDENDSKYFSKTYDLLKKELSNKEIDEENYATLLSELFVIDFYSLSSSINKNDVGGKQFIYELYRENFINAAKDTIYSTVENNIYGDRKQELPIVTNVNVDNIEQDSFEIDGFEDDKAYYVDITIEYKKDLEYPKTVSLVLVHTNNKLEIAQVK